MTDRPISDLSTRRARPVRLGIDALEAAEARVLASFPPEGCDWARCFTARFERANFASRYHVVYPAIAWFSVLRRRPERARELRAVLDVMYEGLVEERCWGYWHTELHERSGAIVERNLTYAGRLAVFVGLYLDAFGDTPSPTIDVDGDRVGYHELSARLAEQMATSPSCGVSCYHHESMVMCNAALMINNVVHDRLAGTRYADLNETWMRTVRDELVRPADAPTVFFYGTEPDGPAANPVKTSLGMDAWALALLSAVAPTDVAAWYPAWRAKLRIDGDGAWVPVDERRETPARAGQRRVRHGVGAGARRRAGRRRHVRASRPHARPNGDHRLPRRPVPQRPLRPRPPHRPGRTPPPRHRARTGLRPPGRLARLAGRGPSTRSSAGGSVRSGRRWGTSTPRTSCWPGRWRQRSTTA